MAPPPRQERYNAKARGSVAGGSSHKKRKRQVKVVEGDEEVQNHGQMDGVQAVSDFVEPGQGMSTKKRKRLESYIAKKLKTEERLKTIQLLASLAPSSSTSATLLSSASVFQNPSNPTSAKERSEAREDRLVRRGIERMRRRGAGGESETDSEQETTKGKGKGKEREVIEMVHDGDEPDGAIGASTLLQPDGTKPESRKKRKAGKKADWNPNLLSTQPQSSSSEFDSSDSNNDSPSEAGPSSPRSPAQLDRPKAKLRSASPPTQQREPQDVIPPTAEIPNVKSLGTGGALKRGVNGQAVQPRVEVRRKQKVPLRGKKRVISVEPGASSDESESTGQSAGSDEDEDDVSDEEADASSNSAEEDYEESELDSSGEDNDGEGDDGEEDEEEDGDDSEDGEEGHQLPDPPVNKRALGFKAWAQKQMESVTSAAPDLLGVSATASESSKPKVSKSIPHTGEFVGPLGAQLDIPATSLLEQKSGTARPTITRRPSVAESRMDLPILAEEQPIIEAILMNPVVVICGETGSGKTTQVPQMLYEAGFGFKGSDNPGMIAVTQPRRVAAVSLATRVKSELNFPSNSSTVAHQIRYSSTTSPDTAIKFMTDGVLLRELSTDFLLSRYSVVVVDEAHERGVNTDVLVGVLSRVAKLREKKWREEKDKLKGEPSIKPLRIVIMSATLRVDDFTSNSTLFQTPPPVIHISARQHPVTIHFNRKTVSDYVTEAYKKVCKIHARLPPGGILVFMTGQSEIMGLARKLEKKYAQNGAKSRKENKVEHRPDGGMLAAEDQEAEELEIGGQEDLAADVDDGAADSDPEALDSDDDTAGLEIEEETETPTHILPLYSLLPNEQQMLVFKPPPEGHRLVIISTNVAETSLTIPGIRYVVDSGRAKERHYDASTGVQSFQVSWISKASASQRAGRAGRTGPGHCYRLYSSALYEDHFEKFSKPEILRMPIEGVVLQMKSMNIDNVINFPFPTPPDRLSLKKAEDLLTHLGALGKPTQTRMISGVQQIGTTGGHITDLGRKMGDFPVTPRFAKMLVIGNQHDCLAYVIAMVACLSVGDPFIHENALEIDEDEDVSAETAGINSEEVRQKEERKETRRRYFKAQQQFTSLGNGASDLFKMLAAVGAYEYDPTPTFCSKHFLRLKAMQEIQQLRSQISSIAKISMARLKPPSEVQLKVLRQILTSGFIDQIAVRQDIVLKKGGKYTSTRNVAYRALGVPEEVFIHPSSALFHSSPPDFVVFSELVRTSRVWIKGITKVNGAWLAELGKSMCTFSRPMEVPASGKAGGSVGANERQVVVIPHFGALGVDLPAVKKKQRREGTRWVLVE